MSSNYLPVCQDNFPEPESNQKGRFAVSQSNGFKQQQQQWGCPPSGGCPPPPWCPPNQCPPPWCPPTPNPQCGTWVPFNCCNCDASGCIFVPKDCPVYLAATNTPANPIGTTPTQVPFLSLTAQQPASSTPGVPYNPSTGIYTVPQGLGGLYLMNANVTLANTSGLGPVTTTVSINVNGSPVTSRAETIGVGAEGTVSLMASTILYPGQSVSVSAVSGATGVNLKAGTGNLSIVRLAAM